MGIKADTDSLEELEKAIGERMLRSARAQNTIIHCNKDYDLSLDITMLILDECVSEILAHTGNAGIQDN